MQTIPRDHLFNIKYKLFTSPIISINTRTHKMGQMCRKLQRDEQPCSTISLSQMQGFDNVNFTFTVDKLTRINTQCLILFTDKKLKVDKNQFLRKCGKQVANKVQQYFDVALLEKRLGIGQSLVIDVLVPEFAFQKICIVCLQVWSGQRTQQIYDPLLKCLQNTINILKPMRISSITITQFNSDFGLPNDVAEKILIKALFNQRQNLKQLTFVSSNDESMVNMKKQVLDFCQNVSQRSQFRSARDNQSVYY